MKSEIADLTKRWGCKLVNAITEQKKNEIPTSTTEHGSIHFFVMWKFLTHNEVAKE